MLGLLAAAALVSGQGSPIGLWDTPVDQGRVRVEACGGEICGYVVSSTRLASEPGQKDVRNSDPALRSRLVRNLRILQVRTADGTQWKGWVYDPNSGRTYRVTLRMKPGDHLELTGCLVGPLCRSLSWTRAGGA
jgi:uncharacterized protein (DUF2147 family)